MVSRFPQILQIPPRNPPLLIHCGRGLARITFPSKTIVFFVLCVPVPTKNIRDPMELNTGFAAVIVLPQRAQWAADTRE